jgi:hypothetical protein
MQGYFFKQFLLMEIIINILCFVWGGIIAYFVLEKKYKAKSVQDETPQIKSLSDEDESLTPFPSDPNKPLPPKPPASN